MNPALPSIWYRGLPIAFATLLWSACTSPRATMRAQVPAVRPPTVLLTRQQAEARLGEPVVSQGPYGFPLRPSVDAGAVLGPAEVKAYTLGRYVDPADETLMHEAHVVYRREQDPGWRLAAHPSRQILIGPTITARARTEPLRSQEWEDAIAALRCSELENREALRMLTTAVEALARNQEATAARLTAEVSRKQAGKRSAATRKESQGGLAGSGSRKREAGSSAPATAVLDDSAERIAP